MPFFRFVLTKNTRERMKLYGLRCSECGYPFEDNDPVFKRWRRYGIKQRFKHKKEHLCEECYDAKFIDV